MSQAKLGPDAREVRPAGCGGVARTVAGGWYRSTLKAKSRKACLSSSSVRNEYLHHRVDSVLRDAVQCPARST